MKKIFYLVSSLILMLSLCQVPALATGTGDITVDIPALAVGYFDSSSQFQTFAGSPSLFNLSLTNLQTADQANASVVSALTGNIGTITKTDATGKSIVIQNHVTGYKLQPGKATSPWPNVWLKGTSINANTSVGDYGNPSNLLTGTDANKFSQMGLVIQAPYWDSATYQWSVYVYADKDILSQTAGPATGKVLDPRISSLRWWAWADSDSNGMPQPMWKEADSSGAVNSFNTMPLISGGTAAQVKAFLIGSTGVSEPEKVTGLADIAGLATDPSAGQLIYNTKRNTLAANNANNIQIENRSQAGLVYVSPSDSYNSHRTEYLHMQFMIKWPNGVGLTAGAKSCDISIYQKTSN